MGTALCKTSVGNARPCAFALDGVWQYPLDYLGVPDQPAPLAVASYKLQTTPLSGRGGRLAYR